MRLSPLAPHGAERPIVTAFLAAACARPGCDLTADDLLSACHRGEAQLVGIFDGARLVAAGVTQVRELADRSRTCWVLAVGGAEAKAWRHTLREIEAGARRLGCKAVEFVGRTGWGRLLPDYVATPCQTGTHYLKRLS